MLTRRLDIRVIWIQQRSSCHIILECIFSFIITMKHEIKWLSLWDLRVISTMQRSLHMWRAYSFKSIHLSIRSRGWLFSSLCWKCAFVQCKGTSLVLVKSARMTVLQGKSRSDMCRKKKNLRGSIKPSPALLLHSLRT